MAAAAPRVVLRLLSPRCFLFLSAQSCWGTAPWCRSRPLNTPKPFS